MITALKRKKIANSFGVASQSYDTSARLQRYCGEKILRLLADYYAMSYAPSKAKNDHTIVDLGAGTGFFTEQLNDYFNDVIGLDIANGMLNFAKQQRDKNITWLQADAYQLPFADNSIDCIFSNLMIQWCQPLTPVINEIIRVLKPQGHFIFTTLIDGTLYELSNAWASVDNEKHVLDFMSEQQVLSSLSQPQAKLVKHSQEDIVLKYNNVLHLARELKELGANQVPKQSFNGLAGKDKWQAMMNNYQQYQKISDNGHIIYPATYCAFSGVLRKNS